MKFAVNLIKEKEIWEGFLSGIREKTFLQSWNWGEFQKKLGNRIWRFGIFKDNNLISVALVVKIIAKRGNFLFIPHGPLLKSENYKLDILNVLVSRLRKIADEEKESFIRIAPLWKRDEENIKIFKRLGFRTAPIHMHPELSWELDIDRPEEDILRGMRKTTRYLVKHGSQNKDIDILETKNLNDLDKFYNLYEMTAQRQGFVPFSFGYIKNEFLSFLPDNEVSIFLGKYKGEVVSSAVIVFWEDIAFYHHGASSLKYPRVPVSYVLQWKVIKEAMQRGCKKYNFWGIADTPQELKINNQKFKKHPWWGLSLFKIGFGGYKKPYVKTQDLILSQKYWIDWAIEKIRKKKRGF